VRPPGWPRAKATDRASGDQAGSSREAFSVVVQRYTQPIHGIVQALLEVHKGVGWPELVLQFFPGDGRTWLLQQQRISTGWPCSLIFMPFLRSSPARGSSSNTPKRRVGGTELEVFTTTPRAARV